MVEKKISNPLTFFVVGIGIGNLHAVWATYTSDTVKFFDVSLDKSSEKILGGS